MTYEIIQDGDKTIIRVEGRIDTQTAPQLETCIMDSVEKATNLAIDLSDVEYISSSGLRLLLAMQKIMAKQGEMVVAGANDEIKEVFDITGFADILTLV